MKKAKITLVLITVLALVCSVMTDADGRRCRRRPRCRRPRPPVVTPVPPSTPPLIIDGRGADSHGPSAVVTVPSQPGKRIADIDVVLIGLTSDRPDNLDVSLTSPGRATAGLLAAVGGTNPVSAVDLRIDDEASRALPDDGPLVRGTYRPTRGVVGTVRTEAPTTLSVFDRADAAGEWELRLVSGRFDTSTISGWQLAITLEDGLPTRPTDPAPPARPSPETFTFDGRSLAIPDNEFAHDSVFVPDLGARRIVDIRVNLGLTHTRPDDIDIRLIHRDAGITTLMTDVGGTTDINDLSVTFRNDGPPMPDEGPLGSGSVTYRPTKGTPAAPLDDNPVSFIGFRGQNPIGEWTLTAVDDTAGETGTLLGWSLTITVE